MSKAQEGGDVSATNDDAVTVRAEWLEAVALKVLGIAAWSHARHPGAMIDCGRPECLIANAIARDVTKALDRPLNFEVYDRDLPEMKSGNAHNSGVTSRKKKRPAK